MDCLNHYAETCYVERHATLGNAPRHTITRNGKAHDFECSCGWWADGGEPIYDSAVAAHLAS